MKEKGFHFNDLATAMIQHDVANIYADIKELEFKNKCLEAKIELKKDEINEEQSKGFTTGPLETELETLQARLKKNKNEIDRLNRRAPALLSFVTM